MDTIYKSLLLLLPQTSHTFQETYWRIPVNMSAKQMRLVANVLSGEPVESEEVADADDDFGRLYVSDSEDESFTEIEKDRQNRLQRANELIYNDSDNEEEQRTALQPPPSPKTKEAKKSKGGINLFDMVKDGTDQMDQDDETTSNDGHNSTAAFDSEEFNSQVIRRRLAQLEDSDSETESATGN